MLLPLFKCEIQYFAQTSLIYIRLKVQGQFERVSLKNSESIHLLSYQRRSLSSRETMAYSQFVGRSENRSPRILHLEVTLGPGIECFYFSIEMEFILGMYVT